MFTALIFCAVMWIYGILSIVFSFHEAPPALRGFFPLKVPLLLGLLVVFLPEHHQVKAVRISIGAIFLLAAASIGIRVLFF